MLDLSQLTTNLSEDAEGIWCTAASREVSYPAQCSGECFEVEDSSFWFRHRNNCITRVVADYPPSGLILDIGGGNGLVSLALQATGFDAVCLEPSRQGAINAKLRGLSHVICSSLEGAGFGPHTVPAAGMFDVLEHIDDDSAFLEQVRETLQPEGRLYITVPAGPRLWSHDDELAGHHRRYTSQSLRRVLEQTGYKVDYESHFFGFLSVPLFLARTIGGRFTRRRPDDAIVRKREHQPSSHLVAKSLAWLCTRERLRIAAGRTSKHGTSLLVVARAPA